MSASHEMMPETAARLVALNRRFYTDFGAAFDDTRQRLQNGVRRLLTRLPDEGAWLDLGCGNGELAAEWLQAGRKSAYLGVDFSPALLEAARKRAPEAAFLLIDLTEPGWERHFQPASLRGILAFAVLHHIPGSLARQALLAAARRLLLPNGWFVHSVWQFQHSPKLWARRQDWSMAGFSDTDVEAGDTLLDWRHTLPDQAEQHGLRYVHLFSLDELASLADSTGFEILETFESDGKGGRLGLYQVWQAKP